MPDHLKCDYALTFQYFCTGFCTFESIIFSSYSVPISHFSSSSIYDAAWCSHSG